MGEFPIIHCQREGPGSAQNSLKGTSSLLAQQDYGVN